MCCGCEKEEVCECVVDVKRKRYVSVVDVKRKRYVSVLWM